VRPGIIQNNQGQQSRIFPDEHMSLFPEAWSQRIPFSCLFVLLVVKFLKSKIAANYPGRVDFFSEFPYSPRIRQTQGRQE
jgi:hypothetical protein